MWQSVTILVVTTVTLLLTTETIHVVSIEEDEQVSAHRLDNVNFVECDEDPTKFYLTLKPCGSSARSATSRSAH